MRIFSHWTRIEEQIVIGGVPQRVRCHGGSDLSVADAVRDARQRLARAVERARTGRRPDPAYEADIREEIVLRVNADNIVTRNRYGAEVLNSSDLMFVDIDEPRLTWREIFFGRDRDLARRKTRIVEFVKQRAQAPELRSLGLRLYETHNGIRMIITGRKFDPKAPETHQLLRTFNADHLYALLCAKQGCFRARLTPKPHRMRCRTHRVVFPRLSGRDEIEYQDWLSEYQALRAAYATCRHLCTFGPAHRHAVIDFHDQATGAFARLKLA